MSSELTSNTVAAALQRALGSGYTVGRELGGGGMSRVFVARDESLGRDVVVKLLSPTLAQEFSVERFTREIRLAAALQHPHIVPLLAAGATAEGLPYYLMPFVEGDALRARLDRGERLALDETIIILRDVARALAYAHQRGIVHRDIKPDNVMLSGGAAVVTDFGIAKAVSSAREERTEGSGTDSLTRMGTSIGTPAYMAPEQGTGDPSTDHRADIYAFGAMAYELLTGAPPFGMRAPHALLVAHLTETPAPIATRRPDVPPALEALVMRCLAKDPAERPQQATELVRAFDDPAITGARVATAERTTTILSDAQAARGRAIARRVYLGAGAALLVAVGAWLGPKLMARPAASDDTLLAVMPFTVRDEPLAVWREGLVDVLSRSLDGAGTLRTVAPSVAIADAPPRSDPVAAKQLGDRTGAGLVLFGDLSSIGADSVHLRAALYDVKSGRVRRDIDLRGDARSLDALADTLAIRVIGELGDAVAFRSGGGAIGTRSLPALKAFLQGQQYYRRGLVDSAARAYQSAVELDSTFSLGWRGVASIYIRTGRENDPAASAALERAIRFKSGRGPRDSLLLRGDSLRLAIVRQARSTAMPLDSLTGLGALFATLREATTRYPGDAELWFEFGDALYHFGEFTPVGEPIATPGSLPAFQRVIALDSTAVVPYFHASTLALRGGDVALASTYARRIGALMPGDGGAYYRLQAEALASPPPFSSRATALLDSVPQQWAAALALALATTPDSTATALGVARRLLARPASERARWDSTITLSVATALVARGHVDEAKPLLTNAPLAFQVALARIGALPVDGVLREARELARVAPSRAFGASRLFVDHRDTASLALLEKGAAASPTGARVVPVLRAYMMLARGDSASALRAMLALPMSLCNAAPCVGGTVASLLAAAGRDRDAAVVLDRWLPAVENNVATPLDLMLRTEIAERLGDRETARANYQRVLTLWGRGDPVVGAVAERARAGLRRVGG